MPSCGRNEFFCMGEGFRKVLVSINVKENVLRYFKEIGYKRNYRLLIWFKRSSVGSSKGEQ